jgi:hypothetical protein
LFSEKDSKKKYLKEKYKEKKYVISCRGRACICPRLLKGTDPAFVGPVPDFQKEKQNNI